MKGRGPLEFELFAQKFVRKYWETLKSGAFAMPPYEPIEESLEELLSNVSHQTAVGRSYVLRMMGTHGAWWQFAFLRDSNGAWEVIGASANSDTDTPHNLLGPLYAQYFAPFLRHVATAANESESS